jgi:hypothetical protein
MDNTFRISHDAPHKNEVCTVSEISVNARLTSFCQTFVLVQLANSVLCSTE